MQLDVEPQRAQVRRPGDSVPFVERQPEILLELLDRLELIEPEGERADVVAADEEQPRLDVARAAEVVTLPEDDLPLLLACRPLLELVGEERELLGDLDLHSGVGALAGSLAGLDAEARHGSRVPGAARVKPRNPPLYLPPRGCSSVG